MAAALEEIVCERRIHLLLRYAFCDEWTVFDRSLESAFSGTFYDRGRPLGGDDRGDCDPICFDDGCLVHSKKMAGTGNEPIGQTVWIAACVVLFVCGRQYFVFLFL